MKLIVVLPFLLLSLSCNTSFRSIALQDREGLMPNIEGYQKYRFSDQAITMLIPSGWEVRKREFYDSSRNKIAELAPGYLEPIDNVTPENFISRIENHGPDVRGRKSTFQFSTDYTFIKRDTIRLALRIWHKATTKTQHKTPSGEKELFYPHYYVTQVDHRLFIMIFYSRSIEFEKEEIAHTILANILFRDGFSETIPLASPLN
jgi:hypothetical protein